MARRKSTILREINRLEEKPPRPAPLVDVPELETRACACGCGRTFRVMPTSGNRYASLRCAGNEESY